MSDFAKVSEENVALKARIAELEAELASRPAVKALRTWGDDEPKKGKK